MSKPIFVAGLPRSGTTLVQCILSAHPSVYSLPETHYFTVLHALGVRPGDVMNKALLQQIASRMRQKGWEDAKIPLFEEATTDDAARKGIPAKDYFARIVEQYRRGDSMHGRTRLLEKTPSHLFCMLDILRVFADAKFVIVVRNPLDVLGSLKKPPFARHFGLFAWARTWNRGVRLAMDMADSRPASTFVVRYEDICDEPRGTVRRVCTFLELDFHESMLTDFSREFDRNVRPEETWKQNANAGAILRRSDTWQEVLTPREAWVAQMLTVRGRRRLGYEKQVALGVAGRACALFQLAMDTLSYYTRRLCGPRIQIDAY